MALMDAYATMIARGVMNLTYRDEFINRPIDDPRSAKRFSSDPTCNTRTYDNTWAVVKEYHEAKTFEMVVKGKNNDQGHAEGRRAAKKSFDRNGGDDAHLWPWATMRRRQLTELDWKMVAGQRKVLLWRGLRMLSHLGELYDMALQVPKIKGGWIFQTTVKEIIYPALSKQIDPSLKDDWRVLNNLRLVRFDMELELAFDDRTAITAATSKKKKGTNHEFARRLAYIQAAGSCIHEEKQLVFEAMTEMNRQKDGAVYNFSTTEEDIAAMLQEPELRTILDEARASRLSHERNLKLLQDNQLNYDEKTKQIIASFIKMGLSCIEYRRYRRSPTNAKSSSAVNDIESENE